MNRRGFIFSLEAMFALIIMSILLMVLVNMMLSIDEHQVRPDSLSLLAYDVLSTGETLGILQNQTKLQEEIPSVLPTQYCLRIDVIRADGALSFSYAFPGCDSISSSAVVAYRTYLDQSGMYLSRAWMWYRE